MFSTGLGCWKRALSSSNSSIEGAGSQDVGIIQAHCEHLAGLSAKKYLSKEIFMLCTMESLSKEIHIL